MATVKDVAQRAGVSLGTVSNVINGKTKNQELIERVENAIAELGFRPDGKARSLKSTQSFMIGMVIGSLREPGIQTIISAVERTMQKQGYSVLIKMTGNNSILEKKHIESFLQLGVDGIIASGPGEKKWMDYPDISKVPVVFLQEKFNPERALNYICIDYEKGVRDFLRWCVAQNRKHVGIIIGEHMMDEHNLSVAGREYGIRISCQLTGQNTPESGFKAAYELFYENGTEHSDIDIILAGSTELFKGIRQAADILGYTENLKFACIKNSNWIEDSRVYDCIIDISYLQAGERVAEKLLERMQEKERPGTVYEVIEAEFKRCDDKVSRPGIRSGIKEEYLDIAILNSDTAHVLQMISDTYIRSSGIPIRFHPYPYHELWHLVKEKEKLKEQKIDAFMYDIIWKEELVEKDVLAEIADVEAAQESYYKDYIDNVLWAYGGYGDKLYGLPLLTGTQLLFYQKDLLEDSTLKRQFMQKYRYPLKTPEIWDEFRDIAEFFTRKYNAKSPVEYGTSLINSGNLYNSIEFLNILWSLGIDIIEENKLNLDHKLIHTALDQYRELYQYTSQKPCGSWDELAYEFKSGKVAMVILYDSYAFGLNDSMVSKVAGNIESAVIPGKSPVLGGWGLGCLKGGSQYEQAKEYVTWACGAESDKLFSVLSGISGRKSFYLNRDLDNLYPWKKDILSSYSISRERNNIRLPGKTEINMMFYDEILGREIGKIIRGESTAESSIEAIKSELKNRSIF